MPDWSYRTFLQPMLFRLVPARAQAIAIGTLARLSKLPGGTAIIDFLGHMRADKRLSLEVAGIAMSSPVGLGAMIDPEGKATSALARFGFGFIEVGPVGDERAVARERWNLDMVDRKLVIQRQAQVVGGRELLKRPFPDVPIFLRLAAGESARVSRNVEEFSGVAAAFCVSGNDADTLLSSIGAIRHSASPGKLILISLASDTSVQSTVDQVREAMKAGADGVWIGGERKEGETRIFGAALVPPVIAQVKAIRDALGTKPVIVAGAVMEPGDARDFFAAGATLVAMDAGLVVTGPGLAKRTNEALLGDSVGSPVKLEELSMEAASRSWVWAVLLGVALIVGGLMAVVLACTRVVLPYDEALCGIPRAAFASINPKLLPFMAHDRMTLAGTMLSLGILYAALGWYGVRAGMHWAKAVVVSSSVIGFLSFFLFLGFGYFDPFHAFVTGIGFQFTLLCLHSPLGSKSIPAVVEWRESAAWRQAQWGQLLFVLLGMALVGAGLVVSFVGCTSVFIDTDLEFLRTTAAELLVAHERLLPLVAHDRASLGGILITNGLVVWLAAQWGIRAGERWLWHALAWAGNVAFAASVGVHLYVGYTSALHLAPALAGWFLLIVALALTHSWLTRSPVRG